MLRVLKAGGTFFVFAAVLLAADVPFAQTRPNFNIDSLFFQPITGTQANLPRGCWGYVDSATSREYALITCGTSLRIYEVTNPSAPVLRRTVSATGGEMKQVRPRGKHAFAVNQSGVALQVIDMTQIVTNPNNVVTVRNFNTTGASGAHALHIDGNHAYLGMNGSANTFRIVDISNPLNPVQVGSYLTSVGAGFVESHDSYVKGNLAYVSFLGGGFSIVDITNKSAPQRIADITYPAPILNHNCWTTEDGDYLFTTDEVAGGYIRIWDVRDPANPVQIGSWASPTPFSDVHNVQVLGNFLYASYYGEGVEILDIEDPTQPIEVGHFDTDPVSASPSAGCWDFFPYFPSGTLVASNFYGSTNPGMWLLRFNGALAPKIAGLVRNQADNTPLPGVTVRLLDVSRQVATDPGGNYIIRSEAGSRTLEFSRNGFAAETVAVTADFSDTTVLNVSLSPLYDGMVTGQVLDGSSGLPIAGAKVGLLGDEFFQDVTDGNGDFSVSFLPTGQPIRVGAAVWGYQSETDSFVVSSGTPLDTAFRLAPGYLDEFEFELGWSTSAGDDNATGGFWERVAPVAAFTFSGAQTQAGADHTPNPGQAAFITGQAFPGSTFNDHDVDGGKITLTTPLIDLSGMHRPRLSFWRWWNNAAGQNPNIDTFFVDVSADNGANWVNLERNRFSATAWQLRQYDLTGKIPFTNQVRVRFVATDRGGATTVEGGVDDFRIEDTFVLGDINNDGVVTAADVVTFSNAAFLGSPIIPPDIGDYNGDCAVSAPDVILLLNHVFLGAPLTATCP